MALSKVLSTAVGILLYYYYVKYAKYVSKRAYVKTSLLTCWSDVKPHYLHYLCGESRPERM